MRDRYGTAVALVVALAAPASATPREDALRDLAAMDARVAGIAFRLAVSAGDLCPERVPHSGAIFHAAGQYDADLRASAIRLFGLAEDGSPAALAIAPGSPAASAGLRPGDRIDAIDGVPLAVPRPTPHGDYAALAALQTRLDAAMRAGAVTLTVRRDDRVLTLRLLPASGCASAVQLVPSPSPQAGADGRTVTLSTTLVARIASDDQLALVIGHELAHDALGHARGTGRQRDRELAADRLAVGLVARAGYDAAAAIRFWEGAGRSLDRGWLDGGHPGWRARLTASRAALSALAVAPPAN